MEGQKKFPLDRICSDYEITKAFIYLLRKTKGLKIYHLNSKPYVVPDELEALMTSEGVKA